MEKKNGFESLKRWKYLNLIEPTLQAKTASGGKHLFYFKRKIAQSLKWLVFFRGGYKGTWK